MLSMVFTFACDLNAADNFGLPVSVYTVKETRCPCCQMLSPYIHSEELDDVATDFLRRHYLKALNTHGSDSLKLAEGLM